MGNDAAGGGGGDIAQKTGKPKEKRDYKGFVAGVFSGIMKLSGKYWMPTHSTYRQKERKPLIARI